MLLFQCDVVGLRPPRLVCGSGALDMTVDCIRIGSVRMCLALMLGLLIVPAYVVVPVLFDKAGSVTLAGALAGDIFHLANMGIILLIAAVLVFWFRMVKSGADIGRVRWGLLLVIGLLVAGNEYGIAPMIADIKAQAGSFDVLAEDDPQRKLFGLWHGVSAVVHLLASLCAVGLVAMGAMRPADCSGKT